MCKTNNIQFNIEAKKL